MTDFQWVLQSFQVAVAMFAAVIALRALSSKRKLDGHTLNYARLMEAEQMFDQHASSLLRLHGINEQELKGVGLTEQELIYLLKSFRAGALFHKIETRRVLSTYRQNLLDQPIVREAWSCLLKPRFMARDRFTQLVDQYIASHPVEASAPPRRQQAIQESSA
jgi:hypothetical protein